ncbi:MAG: alpha/beta fold hydrolase [Candidatus Acidiferrales bacterium]
MIRKILKYVAIAIACLVVLPLSSALLYRKYLQQRVAQERAINSPIGINSLEAARIGGIDQWIEVRGQDVNNPILLFIHGGPGIPFIPLAGAFQGPWEKYFTVVQWDQRGAGKTYTSNSEETQRRTMNVPQMEQDTLGVANYLRNRFKREKIFVVGHSWGSSLGLWLAHEHPEAIYAYVGTGQVVNMEQNEKAAYQDTLQEVRTRHNERGIKELESIAPYPPANPDFEIIGTEPRWASELLGPPPSTPDFTNVRRLLTDVISAPEYSLEDDYSFIHGQTSFFSIKILLSEMMKMDFSKLGLEFRAPVFFFEGRRDPYCRPSLIWDYTQTIQAPKKDFIWFEKSGHFPFYEEPQKFTAELVKQVLPLATSRQAGN